MDHHPVPDKLLTIAEAAEEARVPLSTLRTLRATGRGPKSFRLGRRVVVRQSDLWAWIDEQAEADTAPRPAVQSA